MYYIMFYYITSQRRGTTTLSYKKKFQFNQSFLFIYLNFKNVLMKLRNFLKALSNDTPCDGVDRKLVIKQYALARYPGKKICKNVYLITLYGSPM